VPGSQVVVASHNLVSGWQLSHVRDYYRALRRSVGLDILCLQHRAVTGTARGATHLEMQIAEEFEQVGDPADAGVVVAYDRSRLRLLRSELWRLPPCPSRPWRREGGVLRRRSCVSARIAVFDQPGRRPFTVVNFALDRSGGNGHRRRQVAAIVARLGEQSLTERVVACGDTHAVGIGVGRQLGILGRVMSPLRSIGVVERGTSPTHFFARDAEPKSMRGVAASLGRLGFHRPKRLDVVCTNLPVARTGQVTTDVSDHDLLWTSVYDEAP